MLLVGPPGLGKTTLAQIVREELDVGIRTVAGPALERKGDMAAILTALEARDVLFVDEIHRVNRAIEEILYPALEDFRLDIIVGQGPAARTLTLDLPPFTLVGATTRTGLLTTPLRDRFGMTFRLGYYDVDQLATIVRRSAGILGVEIDDDAAAEIARRSRGTPRIANRILRRVRDVAEVRHDGAVSSDDRPGGARSARGRRRGARGHGSRAARCDRTQVRRRSGRPFDARGHAGRGAGHDRGRLRAVPAPARLPPANAARARHHEARSGAHRRSFSSAGRGSAGADPLRARSLKGRFAPGLTPVRSGGMSHPELPAEQRYVDHAYVCLERMRDVVSRAATATDQEVAALALEAWSARRLATFEDAERGLLFGRLDFEDVERPLYVGRRWVHDDEREQVVVNWQAPAARPFYTATPVDPQRVTLRRRFRTQGRRLLDIADEALDGTTLDGASVGDFLLEELERSRESRMRDIVATIQADQYRLITREPERPLVIQGGPGTGKTAVGLHRASWLLYTFRERLSRARVLVVGPNRTFMEYVSHVLPALGENAVEQRAVSELVDGVEVTLQDPPEVARLKADPRLAEVVAAGRRAADRR